MPDREEAWHISSAVIAVLPGRAEAVAQAIARLPGVEVHGRNETRLVVVIEGANTGELGDRLTAINLLDGVVAATMVFEHVETPEVA